MAWVLGVAASHNGAACLLRDGEIVVALQEERVTREKRAFVDAGRPSAAIEACLRYAGISAGDLGMAVGCSPDSPDAADLSRSAQLDLRAHGVPSRVVSHHLGHAAGAFATAGFDDATVLVIDGMGSRLADLDGRERAAARLLPDWDPADLCEHASIYRAVDRELVVVEKHVAPLVRILRWFERNPDEGMPPFESLGGIFNSVATRVFGQFFEAGKVMGLAPCGRVNLPAERFFEIVDETFRFHGDALDAFDGDALWPHNPARWQNLAASAQAALERGIAHLVRRARTLTSSPNLCYAGGVALNGIANEQIVARGGFERVFIMPAAEDSGTAIGAAYLGAWELGDRHPPRAFAKDSLGPVYSAERVQSAIAREPRVRESDEDVLDLLCAGRIIGWFSAGSELGPRALGQRSILCDPRSPSVKRRLNAEIKRREAYRPFAPLLLREHAAEWFEGDALDTPFMLHIRSFREAQRERVPAVVHVDGTGRPQTISDETHPRLCALLRRFYARTGVPMLLNTSFNVAGEPIVETPEDAIASLLSCGLDAVMLEQTLVVKR
ncbi:MAG: hypothetical protein KC503_13975 [Myxococcales bacterium]|nr:hypothetical protein [Myxococcales bacterium]